MDNFSIIMKLAPGSDAIELDSVTLSFNLNDQTQTLTANTTVQDGNTTNFGVEYIQQGTNYQQGVLVRGDVIRINFISSRAVTAGEDVRVNFIPKTGTPTYTSFTVPDVISTQRVYLYP